MTALARFNEEIAVENMLEALVAVCKTVDGVRAVKRLPLPLNAEQIAQEQTPTIVIDDPQHDYGWTGRFNVPPLAFSHGGEILVRMQLIAESRIVRGVDLNAGTIRNAFARAVIQKLANNATLKVQLPHETEPTEHCEDVLQGWRVDNIPVPAPNVTAIITLRVAIDDVLEDERTPNTTWTQVIAALYPEDPESEYKPTITKDLT